VLEKDLNRVIISSFNQSGGFGYKIPDPLKMEIMSGMGSGKRPYDGFGINKDLILYYEAKFIKDYKAFSFSSVQDHQFFYLSKTKEGSKNYPDVKVLIILGVWLSRKFFDVFFFDLDYIKNRMKTGKSIKKKELLQFKENNMFLPVTTDKNTKKKIIDLYLLKSKIIE